MRNYHTSDTVQALSLYADEATSSHAHETPLPISAHTHKNLAVPSLLHEVFEKQVRLTPENDAVEFFEQEQRLTYRQLNDKADRLAVLLRARGIGANQVVGLYLPRSIELYIAMLGILKAGGAYLPIDVEFPDDRVLFTLEDAEARITLTNESLLPRLEQSKSEALDISALLEQAEHVTKADIWNIRQHRVSPEDLCYIIYTSGTTGRPKGVCISHLNVMTFVQAIIDLYEMTEQDRVIQGFSTAFDASLEEIWMAFSSGGTLVVGTQDTMRAVDELPEKLRAMGITAFSTVPTLLGVMPKEDLPALRLLIFGGEAARADIIEKWTAPGRRLMNGYGPTECSVVSTYTWCKPNETVTIGGPLPRYEIAIMNDQLEEVEEGQEGELCVGGPGVSLMGYLKRPDLNKQKFFVHNGIRYYRTGDLVRLNDEAKLLFLGRIDSQVKIRGYRVELEEIETHIIHALEAHPELGHECEGAIVAMQKDQDGSPHIVAFLIQEQSRPFDVQALLAPLREKMPSYMIPTQIVSLAPQSIPRMNSGKVDRRALPIFSDCVALSQGASDEAVLDELPEDACCTTRLHFIWRSVLQQPIGRDDSFFAWGGNSVLAAQVISRCRQDNELSLLSIRDLYQNETVHKLVARLRERQQEQRALHPEQEGQQTPSQEHPKPTRVSRGTYLAVATSQISLTLITFLAGSLFFFGGLYSAVYAGYHGYSWVRTSLAGPLLWVMIAASFLLFPLIATGGVVAWSLFVKWVLVGRFEEGDYPVWSWGYFRWWFNNVLMTPARALVGSFVGTPFAPFFFRLLGAKIGKNVYLGIPLAETDLVTIEDGATISDGAILRTHAIDRGVLKLRKIHVGADVFVGAQAVLKGGVHMEQGARLHPLSSLNANTHCPAFSEWRGSPASPITEETSLTQLLNRHEQETRPEAHWERFVDRLYVFFWQSMFAYFFGLIRMVPFLLELGALALLEVTTGAVFKLNLWILIPAALLFATLRFYLLLGSIIAAKWLLTGRAIAGTYALNSLEYVRRWFTAQLMHLLVDPRGTRGVTETMLMPYVCRWLGMKVGKMSEISDARGWQPDLVSIGEGSMLADSCYIGAPVIHRGLMTLGHVHIGDRTFIANAAHVAITTPKVEDGCLIGVLSIAPDTMEKGSDWLGSPPMRLPRRVRHTPPDELTWNPPKHLVYGRAFSNYLKMVAPGTLTEMLFWVTLKVAVMAYFGISLATFFVVFPLIMLVAAFCTLMLPVAAKWLLVGRYEKGERFLWTAWMWRSEIVYEIELLIMAGFGEALGGTPLMSWWYRMKGAKIGRAVCILNGQVMEADLTTIGDYSCVEGFLQTHLFEDRVMKLDEVRIGSDCSVGSESCVLYSSEMGDCSSLADLSLIMKNETFLANHHYRGIPAENVPA
ncbi:MAG: amino acid adenylation domain-containing protein [Myxococcales bacterium]|nr:amino acid adenylation domain-containing protein [Myxococcales bacterium]